MLHGIFINEGYTLGSASSNVELLFPPLYLLLTPSNYNLMMKTIFKYSYTFRKELSECVKNALFYTRFKV